MPPKTPATERVNAPAPVSRRTPQIERQGAEGVPVTSYYPQVRGGICEYCGVLDPRIASEHQYKLCPHFRALGQLRCSYCEPTKDPNEVVGRSVLNIHGHPDNPDKLVVVCDSYTCSQKHEKRFKTSS